MRSTRKHASNAYCGRSRDALAGSVDGALRHVLALHHREIERASLDPGYLESLLRLQANPAPPRDRASRSLRGRGAVQPAAAWKRGRFEARTARNPGLHR